MEEKQKMKPRIWIWLVAVMVITGASAWCGQVKVYNEVVWIVCYAYATLLSESEIVNVALNEFFKVKILKDDMDDIAELMGKAIDSKLGKKFERMIMLIAKAGKSSYASLFLQAYFLSKVCETEESKEFLKEKIELANKLAYGVIKNKFLDEDIRQMIPDDLDFDNMEQ